MKSNGTVYHWQSQQTGEVVENIGKVVKTIFADLRDYKVLNVLWKFKKAGF